MGRARKPRREGNRPAALRRPAAGLERKGALLSTPDEAVREELDDLRRDRESGATALGLRAARMLVRAAGDLGRDELRTLALSVREARTSMAPVVNAALTCLGSLEEGEEPAEALRRWIERLEGSEEKIRAAVGPLLPAAGRLLVLSWSGTVTSVLEGIPPAEASEIWVCESRPALEGRRTARALAEAGHRVRFGTEAAAGSLLGPATLFLSGADALYPDGAFANKVGSRLLAAAVGAEGGSTVVVSATAKARFGPGWEEALDPDALGEEPRHPDEVWEDPPPSVAVANPTFEKVPARLVGCIVTEGGRHDPATLARDLSS